jgi:hypothetical protein
MFSKIEIAGIAVSVTAMAAALYLLTVDSPSFLANRGGEDQMATPGAIFVRDGENPEADLRDAVIGAVDGNGTVQQMIIDDVVVGTGDVVQAGDTVTVHYIGTLQNGQEFDNSNKRGEAFTFTLGEGKVIKGWEQGLVGMQVGGKRILVIPSDLAYGDKGYGPIPAKATLIFAIDLLERN